MFSSFPLDRDVRVWVNWINNMWYMNNRCRTIKMIRLIKKESVQFSSDSLWTIINLSVERKEDTFSKPSLLTVHVAFNILAIPKTFPFPEITPRNQHQIVPHYRQPNRQSNWNYLWLRSWSYQPNSRHPNRSISRRQSNSPPSLPLLIPVDTYQRGPN